MKIAIIASQWIKVPPDDNGFGAQEYLAYHIAVGLKKRGHEVTLFASGDSTKDVSLISVSTVQVKDIQFPDQHIKDTYELMSLSKAYGMAGQFDIIHNHLLPFGLLFAPLTAVPTVHTLHHKIRNDQSSIFFYYANKTQRFISISKAQRAVLPDLNYVATVYNGTNTDYYVADYANKSDYLLYLGRMRRYKGIHTAIAVAKKLHVPLKIAAPLPVPNQSDYAEVMEYWEQEIQPHIGGGIEFCGEVASEKKLELLQHAKALIFPVEREEPFGMAVIEAMACGTPVVSYDGGALPELVVPGETGYLSSFSTDAFPGLCAAAEKLYQLDAEAYASMCAQARKHVVAHFAIDRMVDAYEAVYTDVIQRR